MNLETFNAMRTYEDEDGRLHIVVGDLANVGSVEFFDRAELSEDVIRNIQCYELDPRVWIRTGENCTTGIAQSHWDSYCYLHKMFKGASPDVLRNDNA